MWITQRYGVRTLEEAEDLLKAFQAKYPQVIWTIKSILSHSENEEFKNWLKSPASDFNKMFPNI